MTTPTTTAACWQANIYGDSLMKGTVIDENLRYHTTMAEQIRRFEASFPFAVRNRACFGLTIGRGEQLLDRDIAAGLDCDYALLEFGGNDCDFNWQEIAEHPQEQHQALTPLARFSEIYQAMIERLRGLKIKPILVNLPPLDAERYYAWICRGIKGDSRGILAWLGEVQTIYRWHESYSQMVEQVAAKTKTLLVDIRSRFLALPNYRERVGLDGIHLNREGYQLVGDIIMAFVKEHLPAAGR